MKDVNKIILIGRVGADPIQRETKNGVPVVNFPLATRRRLRGEGPEAEVAGEVAEASGEETQWHRVVVWGREGEVCTQYLRKGQAVYVEGSVRSRKFEAKDGTSRMAFEVHADNVSFLGRFQGLRVATEDDAEEGTPGVSASGA
jgi:single-strand DNA-binding protein